MKTALMIVESQPVNVAEIIALFSLVNRYEHIFLCVQKAPMVTSVEQVMAIWETIIVPYESKITLCFGDSNFLSVSTIPDEYKDCQIITISPEIFVHLQSLNLEPVLLPRLSGYNPMFMRAAFRQSKALEWIQMHTTQKLRKLR